MATTTKREALWNYNKDIWKIKVEKISKSTKNIQKPFNSFFKFLLTDGQDIYRIWMPIDHINLQKKKSDLYLK